jgi:hypothetical protein
VLGGEGIALLEGDRMGVDAGDFGDGHVGNEPESDLDVDLPFDEKPVFRKVILGGDDGSGLGVFDRRDRPRVGALRGELERFLDAAGVPDLGAVCLAGSGEKLAIALRRISAVRPLRPQHVNLVDGHR